MRWIVEEWNLRMLSNQYANACDNYYYNDDLVSDRYIHMACVFWTNGTRVEQYVAMDEFFFLLFAEQITFNTRLQKNHIFVITFL